MSIMDVAARLLFVLGLFASSAVTAAHAAGQQELEPASASADGLPSEAAWLQRRVHAGIVYVLDNAPGIRRYDIRSASWLADIALSGGGDAFDVDASGIYVKFFGRVERYALDGAWLDTLSIRGDWPLFELSGNALIVGNGNYVWSYNKLTGSPISSVDTYPYRISGASRMGDAGHMFGRTSMVSPADIVRVAVNRSGVITSVVDSPYHGDFPNADMTYAREAGGFVLDSSGTVYASDTLAYLGSLGGAIRGVAFLADRFVVLRGEDVVVFSNDLRELGRIDAPSELLDIVVIDGDLYAICGSFRSLTVLPLAATVRPALPPPVRNEADTPGRADFILGNASDLLLVSKAAHAAYAFDPAVWAFAPPLPLFANPLQVAYSPDTRRVHAAHAGGGIYSFPRAAPGTARWLNATPYSPFGLQVAGEYVYAVDGTGGLYTNHYTFSPAGVALSRRPSIAYSRHYEWDPVLRRMYSFEHGYPKRLSWWGVAPQGAIAGFGSSPYEVEVRAESPIRISPDGARIALGSGQVFESGGLTPIGDLGQALAEIAWSNGSLYAITSGGISALQRYDANYQVASSGRVRGTPRRLLPAADGFIYLADVGPTTIIGRLDASFAKADLAVDPLVSESAFEAGSVVNLAVSLGNNGTVSSDGATVRSSLAELESASWRCVPVALVTGCAGAGGNGAINHMIDLADGGQATYEISGWIPATARNEVLVSVEIIPAVVGSDPELRNNKQTVRLRLDRLFDDGFE